MQNKDFVINDADVNRLNDEIKKKYKDLINKPLEVDLESMWDKSSCITYASLEGVKLRENYDSIEEQASYCVRYAVENYPSFAAWMKDLVPNCKAGYKQSTLRIVNKIKEMKVEGKVDDTFNGWRKLTDLLRAMVKF